MVHLDFDFTIHLIRLSIDLINMLHKSQIQFQEVTLYCFCSRFQMMTVPWESHEASRLSSQLKHTSNTGAQCPWSLFTHRLVSLSTSKKYTVASSLPVTAIACIKVNLHNKSESTGYEKLLQICSWWEICIYVIASKCHKKAKARYLLSSYFVWTDTYSIYPLTDTGSLSEWHERTECASNTVGLLFYRKFLSQ